MNAVMMWESVTRRKLSQIAIAVKTAFMAAVQVKRAAIIVCRRVT